jgi:hypothetical protein
MTLRAGSSVVAFAFVVVAAALLLGDAVLRGSWEVAARSSGIALLVVWAGWMLLVRPSIRLMPDRAVVVNVGRITEVPWARIVEVRRRLQLILELDDGRRIECWGSPFPRRRMAGRTAQTDDDDPAAAVLRSAWQSRSQDTASSAIVVRRADTVALLIGAGALAAAGLTVALGGGVA